MIFFFLLEVASAPTELKLFTEQALGPGGGGAAAARAITVDSITHGMRPLYVHFHFKCSDPKL